MVTGHNIIVLMCLYGSLTGCIGSKWHWVRVVSQHIRTTRMVIHFNSNLKCILCIPCEWSECICKLLLLGGCTIWASTICRWVECLCSIVVQDLIADIVSLCQIGKLWDLELKVISTVIANKINYYGAWNYTLSAIIHAASAPTYTTRAILLDIALCRQGIIGRCLAFKVVLRKLLATREVWVIIICRPMMRGVMDCNWGSFNHAPN